MKQYGEIIWIEWNMLNHMIYEILKSKINIEIKNYNEFIDKF